VSEGVACGTGISPNRSRLCFGHGTRKTVAASATEWAGHLQMGDGNTEQDHVEFVSKGQDQFLHSRL
jgi:hypothetical protein